MSNHRYYYLPNRAELQLDRQIPVATFQGVGLSDVFDFMRDVSGADFEIDWQQIEAAGINRNATIDLSLKNQRFCVALLRFVQQIRLAFSVENGVIRISTRERLLKPRDEYRQAWPVPSDSDLEADESLRAWLQWAPSAIEVTGNLKGKTPERATEPRSDEISDVFDALADAMHVPIDVKWDTLTPLGISPKTHVSYRFAGVSSNWVGRVIQQLSPNGEVQYQLRDGRVVVASRAWFNRGEKPAKQVLASGALGLVAVWLVVLVALIRRKRAFWLFWILSVLLAGVVVALLVARTRVPKIHWRAGDKSYILEMTDADTIAFRIRPIVLSDAGFARPSTAKSPVTLFSRWHTSLIRTGTFNSEIRAAAPCMPIVCLLLFLPACRLMLRLGDALRRKRRRSAGRCLSCGYDLRFSQSKCPECGAVGPATLFHP
ncbi:MAG TPA: hypothetical protein VFE47_31715 [Tepidisphaeraceae bacterium]|nr:hypothetical protein [Tepidisphaeraceae bacterium]